MTVKPPPGDGRLLRPHTGIKRQHLLISLLADYWFARPESIPNAALFDLLSEFGANKDAARQAVRRLTTSGMLTRSGAGRGTSYGIPPEVIKGQRTRLRRAITFGEDFVDWDGMWTLVAFSIPEAERDFRRRLRIGLRTLKFGPLHDGVWVSPRDLRARAGELLDDLAVPNRQVMRASWETSESDNAAISDAFELTKVAKAYEDFIARHQATAAWASSEAIDPREALVVRTTVTNEWLSYRTIDPELPVSLLPAAWPRPRARALFLDIYDRLGPAATARFKDVIAAHDPDLARLAAHHTSVLG